MATRGHHGVDQGQMAFAARCYENAYGYAPRLARYRSWFLDAAVGTDYRAVIPELKRSLAAKRQRRTGPVGRLVDRSAPPQPGQVAAPTYGRVANNVPPARPFGGVRPAVGYPIEQPPDPTTYYDPSGFDFR